MMSTNILKLEQYLYSLSIELFVNVFEIVPIKLIKLKASKSKAKHVNDKTEHDKQVRLQKDRISKRQKTVTAS